MKAGRDLDLLIHVHFFNKRIFELDRILKRCPKYSTNPRSIWDIVEMFQKKECKVNFGWDYYKWTVCISPPLNRGSEIYFSNDSLPYAFCIAALLYLGWTRNHE